MWRFRFADGRTDRLNDLANAGTFLGDTIVELVLAPVIAFGLGSGNGLWSPPCSSLW